MQILNQTIVQIKSFSSPETSDWGKNVIENFFFDKYNLEEWKKLVNLP